MPAAILGALILLFPESPRWLIACGKTEAGLETLAKLHAHGDVNDAWVRAEFDQIQDTITYEREHEASSLGELFKDKSCFRRLFLACAIQASIQMTGVSAIQYYSPKIYGLMGITGGDTLKYQAISSVLALIAQLCCIIFIDRFGRRWTLIGGNLLNCVFFIVASKSYLAIKTVADHFYSDITRQIPSRCEQKRVGSMGIYHHDMVVQYFLQRSMRSAVLDNSSRDLRHKD